MTMAQRDRRRTIKSGGRLSSLKISIEAEWLEELAARAREHEHSLSAEGRRAIKAWLAAGRPEPAE